MKRRLVTNKEILDLHYAGVHSLEVPPDAIITPSARDLMISLSFTLTRSEGDPAPTSAPPAKEQEDPPKEPVAAPEADPDLSAQIRGVVTSMARELDPQVVELVVAAVTKELDPSKR